MDGARLDLPTRNQHVLFRLGELTSWAETAAVFSERAAATPSAVLPFAEGVLPAMARLHAREALMKVAADGLKWASAAGQTDPGLAAALGLEKAFAAQAGRIDDEDLVARELARAFPA
ncbi:MAG TPA: hypothetical protein PLB02_14970 [Thermoanaerobaculia bacterium]|nr:hypothetical protein [Thermoanaerobaculia bacterium]